MGKRGGWFSAVRKVLSPESKDKKDHQKNHKSKKWFDREKSQDAVAVTPSEETKEVSPSPSSLPLPPPPEPVEDTKPSVADNDAAMHAHSVALAAAQAAMAAAQAAAEVIRLTSIPRYSGKSREELAAIKIQTAYRGYLARRALKALRGLERLKALIEGQSVKRQTESTLKCMQNLARLQSQIYARRIRMSEENQALQRQLQQKQEKELEKSRLMPTNGSQCLQSGEDWDLSGKSKEQIEAKLQYKQEAALRREKALAYAYSRQKSRLNSKALNPTSTDTNSPHWGWSWLERWMAARPWETRSMNDQDFNELQQSPSSKNAMTRTLSSPKSINKPSAAVPRRLTRPSQSHTTTASRVSSPRTPIKGSKPAGPGSKGVASEEGSKSTRSSDRRYRRHSISGSSLKDDESLDKSQKPNAKVGRPVEASMEKKVGGGQPAVNASPAKKKQPSVPTSGIRRHSVPGKIETGAVAVKTAGKKER